MKGYEITASLLNIRSGPGIQHSIVGSEPKGTVIEEFKIDNWIPVELDDGTIGWLSKKYLKEVELEKVDKIISPSPNPIWLQWALSKVGIKEVEGSGDNPEIVSWFKLTTLPVEYWHDATAWCAVFVNAAFFLNGINGTKSARAFDWLKFGSYTHIPKPGDVVVFAFSHVALFIEDIGDNIKVVGGNQSNAITIVNYKKSTVLEYRRPIC